MTKDFYDNRCTECGMEFQTIEAPSHFCGGTACELDQEKESKVKSPFFLDRDGVINTGGFVNTVDEFQFIDGSLEAIRLLTERGHPLFIVTNQGGIEAGYLTESDLQDIHNHMLNEIEAAGGRIKKIYHCPHLKEACDCRKPKPGMLIRSMTEFQIDLNGAFFVGDYITDYQAAMSVGLIPIAVRTGRYVEAKVKAFIRKNHIETYDNLLAVAEILGCTEPF